MKLNNLSRLTALLLALTMILPTFAVAEDGTDFDQITEDYLNSVAETVVLIDTLVADGYCETCAADVASAGLTAWPVSGYTCLYEHLDDLSASAAYDMLIAYYNANTAEGDSLWKAYITSHNNHVINAANAGSSEYPAIICDCDQPVLQPGNGNHDAACPWADEEYVTTTTLTDTATGITVKGNLPAGVKLTVTQVNATVDDVLSMINQEDYAEEPSVLRYDITLTLNDEVWQPTTPVTVKVPGVYEVVPANPLAEVIHITSAVAAGYEKLANVTVNADGSVTFDATGFSNYYIVAGQQSNGDNTVDDYYILPGVTIELTNVTTYQITYPEGKADSTDCGIILTHTNGTLTFYATKSATLGDYIIRINNSNRTERIHVQTLQDFLAVAGESQLFLTCLQNSTSIPNEPMAGPGFTWLYFYFNWRGNLSVGGYNEYTGTASDILKIDELAASPKLEQNLKGQNVIGVIDDNMGADTLPLVKLDDDEWHELLVLLVKNYTVTISDGTELTSEMVNDTLPDDPNTYRYKMYPYVIKYIPYTNNTWSDRGWHVDCAVVDTLTYSITYEFNIPDTLNIEETSNLVKPTTAFYSPNTLNIPLGDMKLGSTSLSSTDTTVSIYNTLTQSSYEYEFKGWSTSPTGEAMYQPGYEWPKLEGNLILYAIWDYKIKTGMVQLTKNVVFEDPNDERKDDSTSYEFTISFTNSPDDETYPYSITADGSTVTTGVLTNANNRVSLRHGDTLTIHNIPDCTVNIEEAVGEEYSTTWSTSGTGSVTTAEVKAGHQTAITCTNTYVPLTGNLTITKTVIGTTETDTFEFTVELTDANGNPLTGEFGITGANEVETIAHNGKFTLTVEPSVNTSTSVTIADLPIGTKYTVTETPKAGYTANALSESGTISTADGATAEFINTYSVGNLSITKKVVDGTETNGTNSDSFGFTVKLTAPANVVLADNYTVTGVTDAKYDKTEGVITFSLSNNQAAVITGIQVGVGYQVVETVDATKYTTEVDNVANTATSGTIAASGNAHVFTNTYTKGDLTISKTVSGAGGTFTFKVSLLDANKNVVSGSFDITGAEVSTISHGGEFTLTVGNNGVASVTIKDLPAGTVCTVTETPVAGYATTANDQTSLSGSATIQQGTTVTIPFTNTYSVANLTITKKVVPETNVTAPADAFTITVNLTAGANAVLADTYTVKMGNTNLEATYTPAANKKTATLVFDLVDGQTATISGLQVDTAYTVSEADMPYYTEVVNASGATISSEAANKVTVTNMYNTGNLTVSKKVEGTYAPAGEKFSFTLTLKDGNTAVTPPLTVNGTAITWTNNNVYTFELGHDERITIYGIPDGVTYTVTEVQPEGFAYTTKMNDVAGNTATGTANNDPTVTFTNTYKYSKLTITKNVSEDTPAGIADQSFNITVTLPNNTGNYDYTSSNGTSGKVPSDGKLTIKDGEAITIDKVPIGETYSVTEDDLTYFDEKVEPNSGTIVDAGNTVAITNTYKPGKLTISKNVVGTTAPKGQESEEFAFVVTLTDEKGAKVSGTFAYTKGADTASLPFTEGSAEIKLKDGESITFTNLPQGVEYKVEETDDNVSAKYTPTSNGEEGTISETDSNAAFTNTYKFNDLTISKIVVNKSATLYEAPAVEFPFVLVLKDANGNPLTGTYQVKDSDEKIVLGTTFNLKAGESITIQDLPVGATYTVTENAVEGFVLGSKTGDTGSIEANQEYKAIFTNEYHVGQLKISKKVEGADAPKDAEGNYSDVFTFNVSLKDATGTAMTGYTYKIGENGEAKQLTESIELKDGQTAIIDKLPAGTTYVITESHPDYTTKVGETETNTATGTIVADSSSRVEFTNTYKYSHLTIKKTGMKAGESAIFTVTCDGKTYTVVVPNEKEIVIGKLPIGETYTITEIGDWTWLYANTTYQYSNVECKIVEGGSRVDVTNKGTDKWLHDESGVINTYGIPGGNPIN